MTHAHPLDRATFLAARYIQRPALGLVANQWLLRQLFAATSQWGARSLRGTSQRQLRDGSLEVTPPGVSADAPLLFYIHGGGFTIGGPRTHRAMLSHIGAAAGMRVRLQRYPLAPERPFPAASDACLAAWRDLCTDAGAPAALAGDSAGGNLALVTAIQARDAGLPLPRAMALIAPLADLTGPLAARFAAAPNEALIPPAWPARLLPAYLGSTDPADPRASPILGDLSGLPATLIQASADEALADDARRLAAALPQATLDLWPGLQHVWHLHAGLAPKASFACQQIGAWLKAQTR